MVNVVFNSGTGTSIHRGPEILAKYRAMNNTINTKKNYLVQKTTSMSLEIEQYGAMSVFKIWMRGSRKRRSVLEWCISKMKEFFQTFQHVVRFSRICREGSMVPVTIFFHIGRASWPVTQTSLSPVRQANSVLYSAHEHHHQQQHHLHVHISVLISTKWEALYTFYAQ